MQYSSRIRRLKEFISHFEAKYSPATPPVVPQDGGPEARIARMREILAWYVNTYEPQCYWCGQAVGRTDFEAFGRERDPYTIHHVDENRDHNHIDNLEVCHRTCHQYMHKLSAQLGLPAKTVREIRWGNLEKAFA